MNATQRAAMWIVGGMAVISLSDAYVIRLAEVMGLWQFYVMRAAVSLPAIVLAAVLTVGIGALRPRAPWRVAQRSSLVVAALLLYYAALPAIPIAQVAAGMFTSPIWILIFTAIMDRRQIGPRRVASVLVGFLGVCLVLGVGTEPLRPMALVAVAGGAVYGTAIMWTRRYCAEETAFTLAFWQALGFFALGWVGVAVTPLLAEILGGVDGTEFATAALQPVSAPTLWLVLLVGLSGAAGSALLAQGYRSGESSIVGLFDYSFLFWISLWSWLLFGAPPSGREMVGMALIVTAGVLVLLSDLRRQRATT